MSGKVSQVHRRAEGVQVRFTARPLDVTAGKRSIAAFGTHMCVLPASRGVGKAGVASQLSTVDDGR